MKEIVRKSHEKEIAYELSKKSYPDKTGRGAILPLPPVRDRVKDYHCYKSFYDNFCHLKEYLKEPSTLMTIYILQTVVLTFLFHINWLYPSLSVFGVVRSLSCGLHSMLFWPFESLIPDDSEDVSHDK